MNEERFIELLNLYIDREISGPEIKEIEEAIAADPQRQRLYAQYCKIDRACAQVLASHLTAAPKPKMAAILAAVARNEAEVVPFEPQIPEPRSTTAPQASRASWGWGALTGMAAAAAAFLAYTGVVQSASNSPELTAPNAAPAVASSATPVGTDDSAAASYASNDQSGYRTVLVLDNNQDDSRSGLRIADSRTSEDPFAWMAQVQFAPIRRVQIDSLEFKTAEPIELRNLSAFSYPYPGLDDTPPVSESAAFQFQR